MNAEGKIEAVVTLLPEICQPVKVYPAREGADGSEKAVPVVYVLAPPE
jgi:hypothetical protein